MDYRTCDNIQNKGNYADLHGVGFFGGVFQMDKVSKWTTENVTILKKNLKTLRQKVSEAKDDTARFALEEVLHLLALSVFNLERGDASSLLCL